MNKRNCLCHLKNSKNEDNKKSTCENSHCWIYFLPEWLNNDEDLDIQTIKKFFNKSDYKDNKIYFKLLKKLKNKLLINSKEDSITRNENNKFFKTNDDNKEKKYILLKKIDELKKKNINDQMYWEKQNSEINELRLILISYIKNFNIPDNNMKQKNNKIENFEIFKKLKKLFLDQIKILQNKNYNQTILMENFEKFSKKDCLHYEDFGVICNNIMEKIIFYLNIEIEKLEIIYQISNIKLNKKNKELKVNYKKLLGKIKELNIEIKEDVKLKNIKNKMNKNKSLNELLYNNIKNKLMD